MKTEDIHCDASLSQKTLNCLADKLRKKFGQNIIIDDQDDQDDKQSRWTVFFKFVFSFLISSIATLLYIHIPNPIKCHVLDQRIVIFTVFTTLMLIFFVLFYNIASIYNFFTGEKYRSKLDYHSDPEHDEITFKVYRRLLLRNIVLSEAEKMATLYCAHEALAEQYQEEHPKKFWKKSVDRMSFIFNIFKLKKTNTHCEKSNAQPTNFPATQDKKEEQNPFERSYNLAVTDLFVEKALAYLNRKAKIYSRQGFMLVTLALLSIAVAGCVALSNMDATEKFIEIAKDHKEAAIYVMGYSFMKSFTFYGLIILFAVYAGRMGKALFDQAERMKDRRHALRQGRLFVHLNGGKLTIDELDRAFNWNTSQDNAFYHFNPEAQAPWGTMFKEMMLTLRETAKSSLELAKYVKKDG